MNLFQYILFGLIITAFNYWIIRKVVNKTLKSHADLINHLVNEYKVLLETILRTLEPEKKEKFKDALIVCRKELKKFQEDGSW